MKGPGPLDAIRAAREYDGKLSPGARHALLVLATYYPTIRPSLDRLAREMGISRRAAISRLNELRDAGLVTTEVAGSGSRQRAFRTLRLPALVIEASPSTDSVNLATPSPVKDASPTRCNQLHPKSNKEQEKLLSNTLVDFRSVQVVQQILGVFGDIDADRIERAISRYALDHSQAVAIAQAVHRQGDLGSVLTAVEWFEMKASAATEHRVAV